jgi:ppGpp synthetase/RelA/SpoT-type nucleotidyltranferase
MTETLPPRMLADADLEWARAQIDAYQERYARYETFAAVLKDILDEAAKQLAPRAIVQGRPKSIASFGEKIWRKRDKYRNPVNRMTDLCGVRVVTHTAAQVRSVSEFIEAHFEIDWDNTVDVSQRLKPTEFGYRSVHYVVRFKRGVFPSADVDVDVPSELYRMPNRRAEIQVRTVLEHAWADVAHDLVYKSPFDVPQRWIREAAALAALLEGADSTVARIEDGLKAYRASYGDYMTAAEMRTEVAKLELVLQHDPRNAELASRVGKLAITLGDWEEAIAVLCGVATTRHPAALRDLGVALCKLHASEPEGRKYRQGQRFLARACEADERDTDALASLAGTWRGIDERRVQDLYRRAYEVDPSNSYPLANVLEYEIAEGGAASVAALMGPVIDAAIRRSRDQADVGINLPWAYYDMARFYLVLGKPYESLAAYAKAVELSTAPWMIETSERSLEGLVAGAASLPGYEWARRLLLLGQATKFPTPGAHERVKDLATSGVPPLSGPVVVLAGGSDQSVEEQMQGYRELLFGAFEAFTGTILSGGTKEGISGLAGDVGAQSGRIQVIGYLPGAVVAEDATVDEDRTRYGELRRTDGEDFTPLEGLQMWIDVLAAGIDPSEVRLLGINGGAIAAAEYRITLGLGAPVGLLEESGREASKLLRDEDWATSPLLVRLPREASAIQAFVG